MRKIESQMCHAVRQRYEFAKDNTAVSIDRSGERPVAEVRLHGNLIARIGDGFMQLSSAGWETVTTKSRLNALLREGVWGGTGHGIFQKDFYWYLNTPDQGPVDFYDDMLIPA